MNPKDNSEIEPIEPQAVRVPPVANEAVESPRTIQVPPVGVPPEPVETKPISPTTSGSTSGATHGTQGEHILEIVRDTTEGSNILNRVCINQSTRVIPLNSHLISGSSVLLRSGSREYLHSSWRYNWPHYCHSTFLPRKRRHHRDRSHAGRGCRPHAS